MTKRSWFYFVILLQTLFFILLTGSYYAIDSFGEEIRVKTEPIDPTDIFYGDYVVLHYNISTVQNSLWLESNHPKYGEPVWVVLEKKGTYHEVLSVSRSKPNIDSNQVILKGKYMYENGPSEMVIHYGIERYFVQEGTGRDLEEKRGNLEAIIRVAPWGQIKIDKVNIIQE